MRGLAKVPESTRQELGLVPPASTNRQADHRRSKYEVSSAREFYRISSRSPIMAHYLLGQP